MNMAIKLDALTLIGFVGVAVIVSAYFANQQRWLSSEDWRYPLANLIGACLILASLFSQWNFPSAVIEVVWIFVSLYGIAKNVGRAERP